MMIEDANPAAAAPPIEPQLADYTGYLLRKAFVRIQSHGMAAMPQGRHPRELGILTTLIARGPLSQIQLSTLLDINRTIMVKVVDGLESAGYVQRERDPADRRRYALRVTDAGAAACETLRRAADAADKTAFAPLSTEQRARLNVLLKLLIPELLEELPEAITARNGFLIARCHHKTLAEAEHVLSMLDLAPRHLGLLTALAAVEPCSQQRLAGCMGVTGPAIVQGLDELERDGLLLRERNPTDRREHMLRLTTKGRDQLAKAHQALDDTQRRLVDEVGEEETRELNTLLTALAMA